LVLGLTEKLQSEELQGVSETLLVPLHYRVQESRRESSAFKDEIGERFHDAISYDWSKLQGQVFQAHTMSVRTAIFDEQVKRFLAKAPGGLVVNLGAGLDTRFHRIDNGRVEWIELDLPAVIEFRSKLREPANKRHRLIAASALDDRWTTEVKRDAREQVLFVAEGLLPYFSEEEHKRIFGYLANGFPGQEMLFQTMAPSLIRDLVQYSILSKMRSSIDVRWGLDDSTQISSVLNPKVRFISEFPLLEGNEALLPEQIRQKLSPQMVTKVAKIVHVQFDKSNS
jgi:O-methyltransferase involved in polyketide biosynthesis